MFNIYADPKNHTRAYVGKLGTVMRIDGLDPTTANFDSISQIDYEAADGSFAHVDGRGMVLDSNGDLLQGDDGGIWKRTNPGSYNGKWLNMNGNVKPIRSTECLSGAYDSSTNTAMCGAQDNGVMIGFPGQPWYVIAAGDGGTVGLTRTISSADNSKRWYYSSNKLGDFRWSPNKFPYTRQVDKNGYLADNRPTGLDRLYVGWTMHRFSTANSTPNFIIEANKTVVELVGDNPWVRLPNSLGCGARSVVYGGMINGVIQDRLIWMPCGASVGYRADGNSPLILKPLPFQSPNSVSVMAVRDDPQVNTSMSMSMTP